MAAYRAYGSTAPALLALFIQVGSLAFIVGTDHRVKQHLTKCSLNFILRKFVASGLCLEAGFPLQLST